MKILASASIAVAAFLGLGCQQPARKDGNRSATLTNAEVDAKTIAVVVAPLDWKLVNTNGQDESIPALPGSAFHRIHAMGSLLATEPTPNKERAELLMFSSAHAPGPVTEAIVDRYATMTMKTDLPNGVTRTIGEKRVFQHAASGRPRGKVVMNRTDDCVELHYLVVDKQNETWTLQYKIRQENLPRWRSLLAELE